MEPSKTPFHGTRLRIRDTQVWPFDAEQGAAKHRSGISILLIIGTVLEGRILIKTYSFFILIIYILILTFAY